MKLFREEHLHVAISFEEAPSGYDKCKNSEKIV